MYWFACADRVGWLLAMAVDAEGVTGGAAGLGS
jgi:hypothetical protein